MRLLNWRTRRRAVTPGTRGLTGPDAEDLVAQTMEIAWRRVADMPVAEPLPWLYAVAHNVWRNTARRDPGGLEPGELRAALASLRDDDQEILRLVAWDGLAPGEIAVVLGCSPGAARNRLHRARSRLAARLGIGLDLQHDTRPGHKHGDSFDSVET